MQVSVYVVFEVGETTALPFNVCAPLHPPDAIQEAISLVAQLSVLKSPAMIVDGTADRLTGAGIPTFAVTLSSFVPPSPVHVSVYVVVTVGKTVVLPDNGSEPPQDELQDVA